MDYNDTFPLHCERFSIHARAGTRTTFSPNQGFLIPLCEKIDVYIGGDSEPVPSKIPWMDTFVYPWSFTSEIEQEVEFIRVTVVQHEEWREENARG